MTRELCELESELTFKAVVSGLSLLDAPRVQLFALGCMERALGLHVLYDKRLDNHSLMRCEPLIDIAWEIVSCPTSSDLQRRLTELTAQHTLLCPPQDLIPENRLEYHVVDWIDLFARVISILRNSHIPAIEDAASIWKSTRNMVEIPYLDDFFERSWDLSQMIRQPTVAEETIESWYCYVWLRAKLKWTKEEVYAYKARARAFRWKLPDGTEPRCQLFGGGPQGFFPTPPRSEVKKNQTKKKRKS